MQRGQRHALHRGRMLDSRAMRQLSGKIGERCPRSGREEVLRELGQRFERLPSFPGRASSGRRGPGQAQPGQYVPYLGRGRRRQRSRSRSYGVGAAAGVIREPGDLVRRLRVAARGLDSRPEQPDCLAHLGAVKEPLRAPDLAGHPRFRQRLLEKRRLRVSAHQHGDLAGRHSPGDQFGGLSGD